MKAKTDKSISLSNNLLKGKKSLLLALLLGAIYPLGFAPVDFWPATLISLAGFFWILKHSSKRFFLPGLFFGMGQFGVGTSWVYISIHEFGNAAVGLALIITFLFVLYLALYPALFSCLYGKWFSKTKGWYFFVVIAFLWLLIDGLRGWVFSGFPWLYAGYAFIDSPLSNWAPIVGIHGITLLAIFSSILLLNFCGNFREYKPLLMLFFIWGLSWALSLIKWSEAVGEPVTATLIQPSIPQKLKWKQDYLWKTLDILKQQTAEAKGEIVIWPEGAVPAFEDQLRQHLQPIAQHASEKGQKIISGIPLRNADKSKYFNGVVVVSDNTAEAPQSYYKRRLVPFGEYVPLQDILRGLIEFFDLPMSAFSLGPKQQLPLQVSGVNFGMAICYEIVYPQLVYLQAQQSTVLLTISNDAWFGNSWGPEQHLQMARMRALETALPVLRGTNDGITAIMDEKGLVTGRLEKNVRGNLEGTVQPQKSSSWVIHYHPWWILIVVLGMIISIIQIINKKIPV